ncbi:MAG: AAA family ATPase, partial [Methyloligellaceae bacterium]
MSNAAIQDRKDTTSPADLAEEVGPHGEAKPEAGSVAESDATAQREAEQTMRARPIPRVSIQAFCEDQKTADTFQAASKDRRLAKAQLTIQMGGINAALAFYQNAPTPNLIVMESMQSRETMLGDLDRLAEVCDAGTKVVVVGHVNDILLYREMIQKGVSEYIVAPLTPLQVMETISTLYTDPESEPVGQVFAFIGAKGGVGSSTICHNCAWSISEAVRTNVVIADFDLPFGTAGLDFNQDPVQGIHEALTSPERLDEVLLDRLLSKCSERLSLFSAPGTLEQEYDLDVTACDIVLDVIRQNMPIVALDLPHMWTSWAKQVLLQADEIVITATPDLANLRNTKNLIELLKNSRQNDRLP